MRYHCDNMSARQLERGAAWVVAVFASVALVRGAAADEKLTKTILEEYVKSAGAPDEGRMRAAIERCAKSADYVEGRRAFMEKRKPRFTGK